MERCQRCQSDRSRISHIFSAKTFGYVAVRIRILALAFPLLFCCSTIAVAGPPPVFSAGVTANDSGGKGYGIMVKWRGVCAAVMPKHVAEDIRDPNLDGKQPAISVQIERGSKALLSDHSWALERDDLYVSILKRRAPTECDDAPELKALLEAVAKAESTPRDPRIPIGFFISSFGKSSSLQAKHTNELTRILGKENLEYFLRECEVAKESTQGCNPPIVGYSGSPIWMSGSNGEPVFLGLHRETCNDAVKCAYEGKAYWKASTVVQMYEFFAFLDGKGVFGATSNLPVQPENTASGDEPSALFRQVQQELSRLNCEPGTVDGQWGPKSIRAYERFYRAYEQGTAVGLRPTQDVVRAMTSMVAKACPDVCGPNEDFANGVCTAPKKPAEVAKRTVVAPRKPTQNTVKAGRNCFEFTTPTGIEYACKVP